MIDRKNFFDQLINNEFITYENFRGNDYDYGKVMITQLVVC